jgi:hypothetical protein
MVVEWNGRMVKKAAAKRCLQVAIDRYGSLPVPLIEQIG